MKTKILIPLCLLAFCNSFSQTVVDLDQNGNLLYNIDIKGNKVPDYSYVGYKNSDVDIPSVPVKVTINAVQGDNVANIQNAINQVAALPIGKDGFRGAVLLKAGTYQVNDSIYLNTSGVVLIGEGNSTIILSTRTKQINVMIVGGSTRASASNSSSKKIVGSYIPFGTRTFTVESGHTFVVGDNVFV